MEQGLKGIFALFGGLALFLYGMDALSRSLETAAGQRMKRLLMVLAGSGWCVSRAKSETYTAPSCPRVLIV